MIVAFILFGLAALLYLLAANRAAPNPAHDAEIAALIAEHDAQTFDNEDERAQQEYHLYHAIRHLRRHTHSHTRLPLWTWVLAPLLLALATWLWYVPLGGHIAHRWLELDGKLAPSLARSLHLGELPQNIETQAMHTYCQALQTRIDRQDPEQLDTLGQCYAAYGNHANAEETYRRLLHLAPDNDHAALQYAQAALFANPDRAMGADVEAILTRLYQKNPADTLTGILLATAHTRAGAHDKALPVWRQLQRDTAKDHPLYPVIDSTAAQLAAKNAHPADSASEKTADPPTPADSAARSLTVIIPEPLLATLPDGAQLFVSLTPKDSPMPLAVQKLVPQPEQRITFRAQDSMTGADYLKRPDLAVRAFLSADGSVSGARLGELREDYPPDTAPTLTFPVPP